MPGLHTISFVRSGRGAAQCAPDPAFPNGIALDATAGRAGETCDVDLPYPGPECGHYRIDCRGCGLSVAVTCAGRPDDPVSVRLLCSLPPER